MQPLFICVNTNINAQTNRSILTERLTNACEGLNQRSIIDYQINCSKTISLYRIHHKAYQIKYLSLITTISLVILSFILTCSEVCPTCPIILSWYHNSNMFHFYMLVIPKFPASSWQLWKSL